MDTPLESSNDAADVAQRLWSTLRALSVEAQAFSAHFDFPKLLQDASLLDSDGFMDANPRGVKRPLEEEAEEAPAINGNSSLASSSENNKQSRTQSRNNSRRAKKRAWKKAEMGRQIRPENGKAQVLQVEAAPVELELQSLPATKCGYQALNSGASGSRKNSAVEGLKKDGFEEIAWDGRTTKALVDQKSGKIVAILARALDDPGYLESCRKAELAIHSARDRAVFDKKSGAHRRCNSPSANVGVSYGKGAAKPGNLRNGKNEGVLAELVENPDIKRLAGYADYCFKLFSPKVYDHYGEQLKKLFTHDPSLKKPFPANVFPCAAFNFGPQVQCHDHRDSMNCPYGWCAINAVGNFDHTKGGHLVLHDLKVLIQFPKGSVILIPSATLRHSNTPVSPGETRLSFMQFCAGSLLRYTDNGFRTEAQFKKEDPLEYERVMALKHDRWKQGLALICTLEEILERLGAIVGPV